MSSVKVAVRVRPFNDREKNMNAILCISMEGKSTTIENKDDAKNPSKTFAFDYSYWSHDGFEVDDTGYCRPSSTKYADQHRVYQDVGKDVLNNSFEGYNACLFAYGQTGAGKSYSMVGYGANKGIIVRACEEIFQRIQQNADPSLQAEVLVSMLEIYNEQVQDLLQPMDKRPKGGLKIRHTPQLGTFVQDLSKCPVDSYAAIQAKLDEAASGEPVSQKCSEINLVDLAGSERAGSTGATGDRLKEGCAINQSLSALGNVISALADKAAGKLKPGQVVPYRDSALTRILQTALGGNSKTCMIAALSPASVNYEETLSTLRYADRVKQIKNEAVVNENPLEKLIRELREENERLKKAMGGNLPAPSGGGEADPAMLEAMRKQYEEEIEANRRAMEEMTQKVEEEKKRAAASRKLEEQAELTLPTLQNLNEDPFLTGKIVCVLKEGSSTFGKQEGEETPTFRIGGLGVVAGHATVTCSKVQNDAEDPEDTSFCVILKAVGKTMVNGVEVQEGEERRLQHKDRILFGHNNLYVYMDPLDMDKAMPSWEEAMKEVKKDQMEAYGQPQQTEADREKEKKFQDMLKELETAKNSLETERRDLLKKLEQKEQELLASGESQEVIQEKLKELEQEKQEIERQLQSKEEELSSRELRLRKERAEEEARKEEERAARIELEEIMTKTSLLVDEANMIAQELGVGAFFSPKLTVRGDAVGRGGRATIGGSQSVMQRSEIMIRVDRLDSDITQLWSLDLFERKVFEMREIYANWAPEPGQAFSLPDDVADPFAMDPESYQVVGQAYVYLDTIRNLLPIEKEPFPIFDSKGQKQGTLVVSIDIQFSSARSELEGEDELAARRIEDIDDIDSVEDVKGRELTITVSVHSASNLPEKSCRHPQVLYRWLDGMTEVSAVSLEEASRDVVFNSAREFSLNANDVAIEWLSSALIFEVSGKFVDKTGKGKGDKSKDMRKLEDELREKKELLKKIDEALRMQGRSLDELLQKAEVEHITAEDMNGVSGPSDDGQEPQAGLIDANARAPPIEVQENEDNKQEKLNEPSNTVEAEPPVLQDTDQHPAAEGTDQASSSNGDTGNAGEAVVEHTVELAQAEQDMQGTASPKQESPSGPIEEAPTQQGAAPPEQGSSRGQTEEATSDEDDESA
ncbi:kinesin, putative [Eimeria maxima]|uniref:Kinesin, putative n=1 Tax=Eimeria maxima TaxID=5804 RepID=U6LZH6_EIMMA|nr:kinesin, putative [Eimeria maxima]CDJ56258.1 kinesin, putative [Eimeria maxima]